MNKILLRNLALLMLVSVLIASNVANGEESLGLPKSKLNIVQCQKEVLALHPGEIVNQKIVETNKGNPEIHFQIHDTKSTDWLVLCDELTGRILKAIKLDDER